MRFFVDECVSPSLSRYLNAGGLHDAIHPRDRGRLRDPDHVVFARAIAEDRIVVTENAEDFRKLAEGVVRAIFRAVFGCGSFGHERPVPIFQQLARSDPSGRDDVREYPLSLRNVEDLLAERGIDISHETVRFWWNRFGPMFAAEIRKKRVAHMRAYPQWRWHLDEAFVKINGKLCYLWRAVDHEGEVLESVVTAKRNKAAALKLLKRIMKKYGQPRIVVTDGLCSYPAAMKEIGNADRQEVGRRLNNRAENSHQPFRRRERAMQRFRSMKTLQKFSSVHAQVHNHFNQERHLVTRQAYKQRRAVRWPSGAPSRPNGRWGWACCAIRRRPAVTLTKPI